jgi:hypothetical protein
MERLSLLICWMMITLGTLQAGFSKSRRSRNHEGCSADLRFWGPRLFSSPYTSRGPQNRGAALPAWPSTRH